MMVRVARADNKENVNPNVGSTTENSTTPAKAPTRANWAALGKGKTPESASKLEVLLRGERENTEELAKSSSALATKVTDLEEIVQVLTRERDALQQVHKQKTERLTRELEKASSLAVSPEDRVFLEKVHRVESWMKWYVNETGVYNDEPNARVWIDVASSCVHAFVDALLTHRLLPGKPALDVIFSAVRNTLPHIKFTFNWLFPRSIHCLNKAVSFVARNATRTVTGFTAPEKLVDAALEYSKNLMCSRRMPFSAAATCT